MPLKNTVSVQQPASHQGKNQLSSKDKLRNKWRKHGKIKSSSRASGPTFANRHTDKKHQILPLPVLDQLPRLGKRELICMLLITCNYVVSVWRGFLFLWVLGMGYAILLWHSLSLPYTCNYFAEQPAQEPAQVGLC